MKTFIRRIEPSIVRLGILALLALTALWPPGSYHTLALAADDPGAPTLQQSGQIFLPLVRGSGVVPDLRFTPDSVNLTPGAEARVTVRVEPQADLGGATFELPGVQAGVSSRFEAAADGASGTLKLLPGNYSKQGSGDTFPVLVPAGVTIVGTVASNGAKQSFLSASSSTASETGLT